eukprot:747798-Hanusia_phi.AAC.1
MTTRKFYNYLRDLVAVSPCQQMQTSVGTHSYNNEGYRRSSKRIGSQVCQDMSRYYVTGKYGSVRRIYLANHSICLSTRKVLSSGVCPAIRASGLCQGISS